MKSTSELERLLHAVLTGDEAAAAAREAAWQHTLRHVRRRRRARQAGGTALALACAGLVAVTFWHRLAGPVNGDRSGSPANGVQFVSTTPLAPGQVVTTRAGTTPVVATTSGLVSVVRTNPARHIWDSINDRQLFALLGDHPAMIVRGDHGSAELIFVHPEDRDGIPAP